MLTELEAIRAENSKVKNDLKLRESDIRIYHSKYHVFRTQNEVLREQLKNFQQQQNLIQSAISSGTPNELDEIIEYLAIENTPDQSAGSSNGALKPEPFEEPRLVKKVNSDLDEIGNRVSQFDQYQTEDSTKFPNPVTHTLKPTKSTKRLKIHDDRKRRFNESEGNVPKKSVRLVFKLSP